MKKLFLTLSAAIAVTFAANAQTEKGKTIIVSTHIFSLIEKICDRVGIIINGKMVKEDELTSLTKEKKLEDVFFDLYKESVGEE